MPWTKTGTLSPLGDLLDGGVIRLEKLPPAATTVDGLTDATTVGKAVAKAADADAARVALNAASAEALDSALTLEEVAQSFPLPSVTVQTAVLLGVSLFPCTVEQLSIMLTGPAVASDTNYWTVSLIRYRAGSTTIVASKSTRTPAAGGQGIAAFSEWNFDLISMTQQFLKGDGIALEFTPTGAPAALSAGAGSFRVAPSDGGPDPVVPGQVIVSDTFDRADSATTLGSATTGQPWTHISGAFGVNANQAYNATGAAARRALLDSGASDVVVETKIIAGAGSYGLLFRCNAGDTTGFTATHATLYHYTAPGTNASLGNYSQTIQPGDSIRIRAVGSTITVYRDAGSVGTWTQVLQVTDTRNQTDTRHGLYSSNVTSNTIRFDDFKVRVP